jgi:transcriptional regulator with PAS, ATPase and Fis domain
MASSISYLKLVQERVQDLALLMSNSLDVEVTVVDSSLRRIAGTGNFLSKVDYNSPHNSLFREVITSKEPSFNRNKKHNPTCLKCRDYADCTEIENISYPIMLDEACIGVVSVASFSEQQTRNLQEREAEAVTLIQYLVQVIRTEIESITRRNTLVANQVDLNEVINCIDKGIIILDGNGSIVHVNTSALRYLHLSFQEEQLLRRNIEDLIPKIDFNIPENMEVSSVWSVKKQEYRVIYKINWMLISGGGAYRILTFETIDEVFQKASIYREDHIIEFSTIIGKSTSIQEAIKVAKITANTNSTILITGESGTGKELFAHSIHNESYRKESPFISINCASMPETLIETELFGYTGGAFTGALTQGKEGKFEAAQGGTLFLDEIGEFPLHLQAKLLRVLQERKVVRIGSNDPISVDVRIIAATNKDLREMVEQNLFRKDLFYRLHVIPITLSSLSERGGDIILLAEYILKKLTSRLDKKNISFDYRVLDLFMQHSWPGNVREMENVIEYALNFCLDDIIRLEQLPPYILEAKKEHSPSEFKESVDSYEKNLIQQYLHEHGHSTESKKLIAKKLGMSLSTLYRKLQETHS